MRNKRLISIISLITIILYTVLAFIPATSNNSYAADMLAGTLSRDIDNIDDNLYPGYKTLMQQLQAVHPNYVFLAYYTGLDWNHVLTAEYQGHGASPKNLFQVSGNYNGMWLCPLCGNSAYDNGSWCCASINSLAYMMDPRNSLNETDVFQFKDLEETGVSYEDVARVVANYGAYINNQEVIQAIIDASNIYRINPYFLVAKIINEHGANGSTLSNGGGYNGNYVGYFNYFNIGASGNGTANIINSGLSYAQSHGWNSRRASILGGTEVVRNSYINEHSQNTFYYQKFNVSGRDQLASHQYQQNIMAAQSQGASMRSYYEGSSYVGIHTFIIPLYKNMPVATSERPNVSQSNVINYENGIIQNINSSLTVRVGPGRSSLAIGRLNNNEPVKIILRGATPVDGYYWDLIVNTTGTYGYAARYIDGVECIVSTGGATTGGTSVTPPTQPQPPTTPSITSNENAKVNGTGIEVLPNMNCENLKQMYPNSKILNKSGQEITSGNVGTGDTVVVDNQTFTIVKKGDVNGDGAVSILDAVAMLNSVKGVNVITGAYKQAASVKNTGDFNITDVVHVLNYIKGLAGFSL